MPSSRLASNVAPPPHTDPRHRWDVFHTPPTLTIHPWCQGLLDVKRRRAQATGFQLITGHAFTADYSMRFRRHANDVITCPDPECAVQRWTFTHYISDCNVDAIAKGMTIPHADVDQLFTGRQGGRLLGNLLHTTQAFSRPLRVPRPDPP